MRGQSHRQKALQNARIIGTQFDLTPEEWLVIKKSMLEIVAGTAVDGRDKLPSNGDKARAGRVLVGAMKIGVEMVKIAEDIRAANPNFGAVDDGKNWSTAKARHMMQALARAEREYDEIGGDGADQVLAIEDCEDIECGED